MNNLQNMNRQSQNSEFNSNKIEQGTNRIEAIRRALFDFDKDMDDQISKEELLQFLDSNMRNGQKFDRTLANKIFDSIDTDKNGKMTSQEFIEHYISIEEEIKSHAKELQSKCLADKEKIPQLQKLLLENQNEKLNIEGIGQNAKISIEICNVEFLRGFSALKRISIRIRFDDESKETRLVSGDENIVVLKEKFEFKVAKKEVLYFEVINTDDITETKTILGTVRFPLNRIETQEEYDLELEIPDEIDENLIMAKIIAKIQFFWSVYKYYQDQLTKTERNLANSTAMLQKANKLLDNLIEPFKYFQVAGGKAENKLGLSTDPNPGTGFNASNRENFIKFKSPNPQADMIGNAKQYEVADKLEQFIKTTFNKPNIQWMGLIKLFLISLILLGFINTFERSDFISIIVPMFILVIFYTTLNTNVSKFLKLFLLAISVTVGYDLLWLLFSSGSFISGSLYDAGKENSVKFFIFLTSFISFCVKILLGLSIWIQKLKIERGLDDASNKNLLPTGSV